LFGVLLIAYFRNRFTIMKKLLFILLLAFPVLSFSQRLPEKSPTEENVFISVEKMPEFVGGTAALYNYIASSIQYPAVAKENGTQGRVYVSFIIDPKGKIKDVKVLKSLSAETDKEAVRMVKAMPDWIPGMQDGLAVAVRFNLPIIFKLD
jgi:periplasmic protein TonB